MINLASCFTIREALGWGQSQNVGLDSAIAWSKTPYFEKPTTLGLLPSTKFFDTLRVFIKSKKRREKTALILATIW
jgi:hypothetical protein